MQEALTLALEFLDEHPDAAVRILEQHDALQVAAFLDTVPENYAVLALGHVLPAFAAHLCQAFGNELSARLLLQQETARMVEVLRHLPPANVDAILNECPASHRQDCLLLLHYPVQFTGAWIVPNSAVVSSDFTIAEVLKFLKGATEETFSKYVFVVDRDGRPEGRISYLSLLKAQPDQRVQWIMEWPVEVLSAQMLLVQTAKLPCWQHGDVMPVVGAQQQFIGILRHADLRRGLLQYEQRARRESARGDDPVSGLLFVYGDTLLSLFGTASNVVETQLKS
jgi:Mg/Co/Ni transporter MgtE